MLRGSWRSAFAIGATLGASVLACSACSRSEEPAPSAKHAPSAGASSASGNSAMRPMSPDPRPTGSNVPPVASSVVAEPPAPVPSRDPDWDLDSADPAHDYVVRYIRATNRYAEKTPCVTVSKSVERGSRRAVTVADDPAQPCSGGSSAERDVFLVDASGDRLSVDDPKTRAVLKRWPDNTDPEGPAGPPISFDEIRSWKSPLRDALRELSLVPIRLQQYGRGTYFVVTVAGWYEKTIRRRQNPTELVAFADKLCAANGGNPLGIIAGLNRAEILRVRCPGVGPASAKAQVAWESL